MSEVSVPWQCAELKQAVPTRGCSNHALQYAGALYWIARRQSRGFLFQASVYSSNVKTGNAFLSFATNHRARSHLSGGAADLRGGFALAERVGANVADGGETVFPVCRT